jgi:hypothetical protein
MDEAPAGVSEREFANQSKCTSSHTPEESRSRGITLTIPGGNGADGSRATWTKPRQG